MTWLTHQTGAVLAALVLQLPAPGIAAAWAGSVAPDIIDQRISRLAPGRKGRQKLFNKVHRGNSHWFGWWCALFLLPLVYPYEHLLFEIIAGFAFGALTHVGLDMLTLRGVPVVPFSRAGRLGLGLCGTGKPSEYLFLGAMCLGALAYFGPDLVKTLHGMPGYFGQGDLQMTILAK